MNSSANHQWLAELENEDLGELDFIDPLSMQQLAESLADELWEQQPAHELQVQLDKPQQLTYSTGFSSVGDISSESCAEGFPTAISAGGDSMMFSFTGGKSKQLSFSREPKQQGGHTISATAGTFGTPSPTTTETKGRRRGSSSVHEHVVAERKRREKMQLQFATLASIIPDTTKTDKVSLLGSAIDYVHHLRDRIKSLQEEQWQSSGSTAESPLLDNARCCIGSEDDGAAASPKIEAEVRGTTVLLRVVCREKKGVLIMLLTELEKHGLSIVNTNVLPLAESSLNITVTAQIEDESSTVVVELVRNLNSALKSF